MTESAATIMTRNVVSVRPNAGVPEIAAVLARHAISAVPVIDAKGVRALARSTEFKS